MCTVWCSQQVISSFRGIQAFSEMKRDIEANFKQMKQSLVVEEGSRHEPQLAAQYINWWVKMWSCWWWLMQRQADTQHTSPSSLCRILELTQSLTSLVLTLPEELTEDVHQAVTFMSQFLSWLTNASVPMNPDTELLHGLMMLWLWKGAKLFDSTDCWWDWISPTSFTCRFLYCPPECGPH